MGRLSYAMSVSLDGFVETPSRSLDWVHVDEELHAVFNDQARAVSASLYGRRMYELMVSYWPTAQDDPSATPQMRQFAEIWQTIPRIVFSRTLAQVDEGSRLVSEDAATEVARLKAQPGLDMDIGGATLAGSLIRRGLIDEFRIFFQPVVLGAGTPFFPALDERIRLKLLESRVFGSGVVYLRYGLAG